MELSFLPCFASCRLPSAALCAALAVGAAGSVQGANNPAPLASPSAHSSHSLVAWDTFETVNPLAWRPYRAATELSEVNRNGSTCLGARIEYTPQQRTATLLYDMLPVKLSRISFEVFIPQGAEIHLGGAMSSPDTIMYAGNFPELPGAPKPERPPVYYFSFYGAAEAKAKGNAPLWGQDTHSLPLPQGRWTQIDIRVPEGIRSSTYPISEAPLINHFSLDFSLAPDAKIPSRPLQLLIRNLRIYR